MSGAAHTVFVACATIPILPDTRARDRAPGRYHLRGKALQCVGLIGVAVGKEVFLQDALQVMQLLMPVLQVQPGAIPEGYFEYYAPACCRISQTLGEQFVQFLPLVLPPIIHTLGVETDFSMTEVSEAEEIGAVSHDNEDGFESIVMEVKGGQKMRMTMNTTAVMEKAHAAKLM